VVLFKAIRLSIYPMVYLQSRMLPSGRFHSFYTLPNIV